MDYDQLLQQALDDSDCEIIFEHPSVEIIERLENGWLVKLEKVFYWIDE